MSGINSGILVNANPLTSAQIADLEQQALETGDTFVYLDENSKLSFISPIDGGAEAIKDLAWTNTYVLNANTTEGKLTKTAYKKDKRNSFILDGVYTSTSTDSPWVIADIFEFDGSLTGYSVFDPGGDTYLRLVLVSEKTFSKQELLSSTVTVVVGGRDIVRPGSDMQYSIEGLDSALSFDNGYIVGLALVGMDIPATLVCFNPNNLSEYPQTGTYFLYQSYIDDVKDEPALMFTKSISCLTIADSVKGPSAPEAPPR